MLKKLDQITMYKVLIYSLSFLVLYSMGASLFGKSGFTFLDSLVSVAAFVYGCLIFNFLISKVFKVYAHKDSAIITGLILFLLFTPSSQYLDLIKFLVVSLLAMSSKYLLVKNRTHILNPAAAGAFFAMLLINYPATWWVGSTYMFPAVMLIALAILAKQRKFIFAGIFLAATLIPIYISYYKFYSFTELLYQPLLTFPLIFFVSVMVTEPFTMPPTKKSEYVFAALVGLLNGIPFHFGKIGTTPELALILGNIFAFVAFTKMRTILKLKKTEKLSNDIYEFEFEPESQLKFKAGQYVELMIPHKNPDSRGERRYFTIASAPNDKNIKFGIRINEKGSSFKTELISLSKPIYAEQLRGSFILENLSKQYVFIAGGIGITPFISILRNLINNQQKLNIEMYYLVNTNADVVYKDLLDKAQKEIGLKLEIIIGKKLEFTNKNFNNATVYLSGPSGMVDFYKTKLIKDGVLPNQIKTDYFNGY